MKHRSLDGGWILSRIEPGFDPPTVPFHAPFLPILPFWAHGIVVLHHQVRRIGSGQARQST